MRADARPSSALREALVPACGGRVDDQDRDHFDEAGQVCLRPDIVWKVGGSAAAVIDAKYVVETGYVDKGIVARKQTRS